MITGRSQHELVRSALLIDEKPIVGHARDMALLMPHPVPVQGMILVKRPRIDIVRNPVNEINQKGSSCMTVGIRSLHNLI